MKSWLSNAIFYQIYPQSYYDSNADGIGDFNGIREKLDYIQELGFTAVWLNPCFDSPFGDAGYDVRDYFKSASRYGSNEDLVALFEDVHRRGMHIILDLVPGHTSVECNWFRESMRAATNPYTHRYIWSDDIRNDIKDVDGIRGNIRGISDRDGCCGVNYYSCQPALNYGFAEITEPWQHPVNSPDALATRDAMLDVIRFWLKRGCDGFRVDMAFSLVKNDFDQSQTMGVWKDILTRAKSEFPEAVFISEWGSPDKSLPAGFDMDFVLHFGPSHYNDLYHCDTPFFSPEGIGSAKEFFAYYTEALAQTRDKHGLICFPSGNHDIPRISHFCDQTQMKLVFAFMMSMPGVPFVYYGDEIGMRYLVGICSKEGGYKRTGSRTPMQWDNTDNFGFSKAPAQQLYTVQDDTKHAPNVAAQQADKNSVLMELKRLITVRKGTPVLQADGEFTLICEDYPLVYLRKNEDCTVLIAINPTSVTKIIHLDAFSADAVLYHVGATAHLDAGTLTVPPLSATYLLLK